MNPHPTSPADIEAQERFGARLRMQREARELSIAAVVKVTKIPERSLLLLEAGAFRDLPAEVFVRGFLKSYSRCVGLDVEEILREYEELVLQNTPKAHAPSLAHPAPPRDRRIATGENRAILGPGVPPPGVAATPAPTPEPAVAEAPGSTPVEEKKPPPEEPSIFDQLAAAGRSTSRASLAVAVIILVIVATVTLSLLLRRPGHVGDGVSLRPSAPTSTST